MNNSNDFFVDERDVEYKKGRLKYMISLLDLVAEMKTWSLNPVEMLGAWNYMSVHGIAQFLRRFRIKYGIYECF